MKFEEFKESLTAERPPPGSNELLQALWFDANGNWDQAHRIAQEIETIEAAWVHAYLHRREGDESNASYWYHRANQPIPKQSLKEEWAMIVQKLLVA